MESQNQVKRDIQRDVWEELKQAHQRDVGEYNPERGWHGGGNVGMTSGGRCGGGSLCLLGARAVEWGNNSHGRGYVKYQELPLAGVDWRDESSTRSTPGNCCL